MLAASGVAVCAKPPTALVVVVDTDLPVPEGIAVVQASLQGEGASAQLRRFSFEPAADATLVRAPFSFTVVPLGGDASRTSTLTVRGLSRSGAVRVERFARLRFAEGRTLVLSMFLSARCEGAAGVCARDMTCTERGCESATVDPARLPDAVPGQEFSPRDASLDAVVDGGADAGPEVGADASGDAALEATADAALDTATTDAHDATDTAMDVDVTQVGDVVDVADVVDAPVRVDVADVAEAPDVVAAPDVADARVDAPDVVDVADVADVADAPDACPTGGCSPGDIVQVSAGTAFTCALRRDQTVLCWGRNTHGQVGRGGATSAIEARPEPVVDGTSDAGRVPLTNVTQLACGGNSCCARLANGTARCWGSNVAGELGIGEIGGSRTAAVTVLRTPGTEPLQGVVAVSVGGRPSGASGADPFNGFACAVLEDRSLLCWGNNVSGQLGCGCASMSASPERVRAGMTSTAISNVTQVSCGHVHACALVAGGQVRCWGSNSQSFLSYDTSMMGSPVPLPLQGISDAIVEVSVGGDHSCVRTASGTIRCWGRRIWGALGDLDLMGPGDVPLTVVAPTGTGPLTGVTQLSMSQSASCALLEDTTVQCWGWGDRGVRGDGTVAASARPRPAPVLAGGDAGTAPLRGVRQVSLGMFHGCATLGGRRVVCWGDNSASQLGDLSTTTSATPVAVALP